MERSRPLIVVAIAATLAVAAAFVVWLQSQDEPSQSTSTSTPPSAGSTTPPTSDVVIEGTPGAGFVTTAPTSVEGDQVDLGQFSSPTGNIGCVLSSEFAVCEIGDHDYALPSEPADCQGDWGAAIQFTDPSTAPTFGACKTDTQLGSPDLLAYGSTAVAGSFACLSQEVGMTCWNTDTGHGFSLSRAAYALF